MNLIIFDLDGTLALDEHRVHHLRAEPKRWDNYFAECGSDAPNEPIILVYESLFGTPMTRIEVWTGRVERTREETLAWFDRLGMSRPDNLRMRPDVDRTNDDEMKRTWKRTVEGLGDRAILAFEDRQRVVDMWRAEGVVCAQVAKGDF